MRPVDPALATRLRSVKLRVGAVIRAHYRSAASRPAACTHRCPVHCPGAR
jgi:hypothetical protein